MVTTDPIADMLTRIRNANDAYHDKVDMPASKMKAAVLAILKDEEIDLYISLASITSKPLMFLRLPL